MKPPKVRKVHVVPSADKEYLSMRARIMRDFVAGQAVQTMIAADENLARKLVEMNENAYRGMEFLQSVEDGVSVRIAAKQWLFVETAEDYEQFVETPLALYALDVEARVSRKVHKRAIAETAAEKVLAQRHPAEWTPKQSFAVTLETDEMLKASAKAMAEAGMTPAQIQTAIERMIEAAKGR